MTTPNSQSGAILFYIIIAIVLAAGLTALVSRGSRVSESTLTTERARVAAQEVVNYGSTLANTVQKLRLRGCADNQYSFGNTKWTTGTGSVIHSATHNSTSIPSCAVFSPDAGNASAVTFSESYFDGDIVPSGTKQGHSVIYEAIIPGLGDSSKEEIVYQLPSLDPGICMEINNILGVNNPSGSVPTGALSAFTNYDGVFENTTAISDPTDSLKGRTAFCFLDGSRTRFIQVLLIR